MLKTNCLTNFARRRGGDDSCCLAFIIATSINITMENEVLWEASKDTEKKIIQLPQLTPWLRHTPGPAQLQPRALLTSLHWTRSFTSACARTAASACMASIHSFNKHLWSTYYVPGAG